MGKGNRMIWRQENFTTKPHLLEEIQNGDIFLGGKLASMTEDDTVIASKTNLLFFGVNLNNIVLHPTCKVFRCSQVRQQWGDVDPQDPTKGKEVKLTKGVRKQTPMTLEEVTDLLATDGLDDVMFWRLYKNEIVRARRSRNKPEVPPKIPRRFA